MIGTILNLSNLVYSYGFAPPEQSRAVINNIKAKAAKSRGESEPESKTPASYWSPIKNVFGKWDGLSTPNQILYSPGTQQHGGLDTDLEHYVVYYGYGAADLTKTQTSLAKVANIVCPLPEGIMDEVSVEWNAEDSRQMKMKAMFQRVLGGNGAGKLKEDAKDTALKLWSDFSGAAHSARERGLASNTHQEYYFKGMGFRTFVFKHTMMPTTEKESADTKTIIDVFKYLASPGYAKDMRKFTYPSQWEIHFLTRNNKNAMHPNTHIPKIGRCVLDKVAIDYTSEGAYHSFKGTKDTDAGAPAVVTLELSFKEIDLVTKETLHDHLGGDNSSIRNFIKGDQGIRG